MHPHEVALLLIGVFMVWKFFEEVQKAQIRQQIGVIPYKTRRRSQAYIYFWQDADNVRQVKIGRTNNILKRLKTFQTAQAEPLRILAVCRVADDRTAEKILHAKFKDVRIRSNGEWFVLTRKIRATARRVNDRELLTEITHKLSIPD